MRFSPQLRELKWLIARPIAHRGFHGGRTIENSEAAFAAAIAHNYSIECDVQLSADSEALVFHDDTVDRLLEGKGAVNQFTAREIKNMAFKGGTDRVQTLAELAEQVAGRATLVIELKTLWNNDSRIAQRALEVLQDYNGPHALMSYDPSLILHVAGASPRTTRGIIGERSASDTYQTLPFAENLSLRRMANLTQTKPHFISYYYPDLKCRPVAHFRAAGKPVITFTIRNRQQESEARRYCDQVTFQDYLA